MASEVDICNLALANLGQDANVSSINPPEGSADAENCARFYPIARDSVLEEFAWTFASRRTALALRTETIDPWAYSYALPAGCLKPRRILPAAASDDHEGVRFLVEDSFIYADEPDVVLVYTYKLTDTTKFSPKFVTSVGWLLASYLAGPVVKDLTGKVQARCLQMYDREMGKAGASNANSDKNAPAYVPGAALSRRSNR